MIISLRLFVINLVIVNISAVELSSVPIFNDISNQEHGKYPPHMYTESIFLPLAPKNYHPDKTHESLAVEKLPFDILDFSKYILAAPPPLPKLVKPEAQNWRAGNINIDTEVFLKNKNKENNDDNYFANLRNYFDNDFYDNRNAFNIEDSDDDENYKQNESLKNEDDEEEEDDEEDEDDNNSSEEYDEEEEEEEEVRPKVQSTTRIPKIKVYTTTSKPVPPPTRPKRVKYVNIASVPTETPATPPKPIESLRKRPINVVQLNLHKMREQNRLYGSSEPQYRQANIETTTYKEEVEEEEHPNQRHSNRVKTPTRNISSRLPVHTRANYVSPKAPNHNYDSDKLLPHTLHKHPVQRITTTTERPNYPINYEIPTVETYFEQPIHITSPPKKHLSKKKKYEATPIKTGPVKFSVAPNDEIEVLNEDLLQKLVLTTTALPSIYPPPVAFEFSSPKPFTIQTPEKLGQLFEQTSETHHGRNHELKSLRLVAAPPKASPTRYTSINPASFPTPSYTLTQSFKRKRDVSEEKSITGNNFLFSSQYQDPYKNLGNLDFPFGVNLPTEPQLEEKSDITYDEISTESNDDNDKEEIITTELPLEENSTEVELDSRNIENDESSVSPFKNTIESEIIQENKEIKLIREIPAIDEILEDKINDQVNETSTEKVSEKQLDPSQSSSNQNPVEVPNEEKKKNPNRGKVPPQTDPRKLLDEIKYFQ